jgi:hypothetical protein
MGIVRLNPIHETDDDEHIFRVFGNLESYNRGSNDKECNHGLVNTGKRYNSSEEPPTLEFIQAWIDKTTAPNKFVASDLIWSSYFRINERIVNGYRKKRAFVMGGK